MQFIRTKVAILVSITLLQGCVSQSYLDNKKQAEQLQQHMDEIRPTGVLANVESISRPPINITPIETEHAIAWLNDNIHVQVSGLPLSLVLDTVLKGTGAQVIFSSDV
ncbi:type II and III secretion system protein, partial [Photobacterium damselae subsp. damselae]